MQNVMFSELCFPEDIAYGSCGGPQYSTDVITMSSGKEQRNINWSKSRGKYNIARGVQTQEQLGELITFFRVHKGRAIGFRFKDFADYQVHNQLLDICDGTNKDFQLFKSYDLDIAKEKRIITKPLLEGFKLYMNGHLLDDKSQWFLDITTGMVSLSFLPKNGAEVSVDFKFDVPVRFDIDSLSTSIHSYGSYSSMDIPLVEIKI